MITREVTDIYSETPGANGKRVLIGRAAVVDSPITPRVTVTRGLDGGFTAVIGLEGLDPQRSRTLEELGAGISSLNPPTVSVRPRQRARDTHRDLMRVVNRAVTTAVWETDFGADERQRGIAGQLWIVLKTTMAVRAALRLLDEDI